MNPKIKISIFISTIAGWLALGTFMYHFLEKWSLITSFYFSAITLTTVGYGDLHPTTEISRLFTAFYVLDGTTIVVAALGVVGTYFLEKKIKKKQ
ncbi:hypothetical protein CSA08_03555 [Candidatus Gracilibacteria bacterium]|nr:MAG: hypothetical protein CSA08_03555 [Candidatus Gracilibacteria bacterium]